jgi:hypothetical protein
MVPSFNNLKIIKWWHHVLFVRFGQSSNYDWQRNIINCFKSGLNSENIKRRLNKRYNKENIKYDKVSIWKRKKEKKKK